MVEERTCSACDGNGESTCTSCDGKGHHQPDEGEYYWCRGPGCRGGKVKCSCCDGTGIIQIQENWG